MALNPSFASIPRISGIALSTADTSFTSPTNFGTLMTGSASGTRINEIISHVAVSGTSTASVVRLFIHDGTNYTLFDTMILPATSGSNSATSARVSNVYSNLILPSGISLRGSTTISQATHITTLAGDL